LEVVIWKRLVAGHSQQGLWQETDQPNLVHQDQDGVEVAHRLQRGQLERPGVVVMQ
jgi:hypothetical protein